MDNFFCVPKWLFHISALVELAELIQETAILFNTKGHIFNKVIKTWEKKIEVCSLSLSLSISVSVKTQREGFYAQAGNRGLLRNRLWQTVVWDT